MKGFENGKVKCVGYKRKERFFTIGKIYDVKNGRITNDIGYTYTSTDALRFLSYWYVFEPVKDERIVITTDGKTVTARYIGDGKNITASAKCSPDDNFNFFKGAEIALDRLNNATAETTFHVGDRVVTDCRVSEGKHHGIGRIICISKGNMYGVKFDDGIGMHDCRNTGLKAGAKSDKNDCEWFTEGHIAPCYWLNCKVVCVEPRLDRHPLDRFVVGKIYEVNDGRIKVGGYTTNQYRDIESLSSGIGWKLIECVE